ncbi:MAG: ATP-binding cassette domain-containing protein [Pseudomonadota bacterium]
MYNAPQSSAKPLQQPTAWRRWDVLLVSVVMNFAALALPLVFLQVFDRILTNQALDTLIVLVSLLVGLTVLDGVLRYLRSNLLAWDSVRFEYREHLALLKHLLHADLCHYRSHAPSFYLDRFDQLKALRRFHGELGVQAAVDLPFTAISLAVIGIVAGWLVLVPMAVMVGLVVVSMASAWAHKGAEMQRQGYAEAGHDFILESLHGLHTISALGLEAQMMRRYEYLRGGDAEASFASRCSETLIQASAASLSQVVMVLFVGVGAYAVVDGSLTLGALAAGTLLSGRILPPVVDAVNLWSDARALRSVESELQEVYRLSAEPQREPVVAEEVAGNYSLTDVSVHLPGGERPALDGVSLVMQAGETIGITGENGSGKSTFLSLLMGYATVSSGSVTLDGYDLARWDKDVLRANVALLPQRAELFEGTVLDNLTLFRDGKVVTRAMALAEQIGLTRAIQKLPQGLSTRVGQASEQLPKGVQQMIAIVRALAIDPEIGEPKILLYDDAGHGLDLQANLALMRMLVAAKDQKTMVIASHNPRMLELCDRIYRFEEGRLLALSRDELQPRTRRTGVQQPQQDQQNPSLDPRQGVV